MDPKYLALTNDLCRRYDALKAERAPWESLWDDISNYVQPRKSFFYSRAATPDNDRERALFDSTAIQANMTLANGQLSWMTPHETPWFALEPPREVTSDAAKKWLHICTEEMRLALARSNFYTEIHELYLDRGGFGTSAMYSEDDGRGGLFFECFDLGSFVCADNNRGMVDTVFREREMTLRAMAAEYGVEALSEELQKKHKEGGAEFDKKYEVIHAIFPRADEDRQLGRLDAANMPIASISFEKKSKHLLRVSGYEEMPCQVTRFLKWGRNSAYGWSPSWMALPDEKQLNHIEKMMDVLAEVAAFPRMLVPSSLEREIDTRAHGVTYFDENNPGATPKEWLTAGRYDIGAERANVKRQSIERAFHVDLFQMFASLEKQMTAREVAERSSEKLTQFSPTFGRITFELLEPLIQRCFGVLIRNGTLPPPPPEMVIPLQDGTGFIPPPKVVYSSRIALAVRSLHNSGWSRTMEHMAPIIASRPDVLDNINVDVAIRDMMRNDGVPPEWMLDEDQVAKIREARAAQMEAQAQLAAAEQMAGVAEKARKAQPDE